MSWVIRHPNFLQLITHTPPIGALGYSTAFVMESVIKNSNDFAIGAGIEIDRAIHWYHATLYFCKHLLMDQIMETSYWFDISLRAIAYRTSRKMR